MKLIVVAPDVQFKNAGLDLSISELIKSLNCEVIAVYLNSDWMINENINIKEILHIK